MHWWSQPIFQFPQEFQARYLIRERVKLVNESEQNKKKKPLIYFILERIFCFQFFYWATFLFTSYFFNMKLSYCITNCICVLTHSGTCREQERASDCLVSHPVLMIRTEFWSMETATIAFWADESSLQPLATFFFKKNTVVHTLSRY